MISHKYRCIFVHIKRTGGTSVEEWIYGENWTKVKDSEKHLQASQAKTLYKDYWDDYFKFSIVRNPWDRMVSCLNLHPNQIGVQLDSGSNLIRFDRYIKLFGYPYTLEYDNQYYNKKDLERSTHSNYCVYGNLLDEELDFIARFENLDEDMEYVRDKLGIIEGFNHHVGKSKRKTSYVSYYNNETKNEVYNLFYHDIKRFGYKY